jgi:integrase
VHVAAWVEDLSRRYVAPTVKQHLAAVRMLFDWLVTGQAVRHNPAAAVRGPRHVVRKGKTPRPQPRGNPGAPRPYPDRRPRRSSRRALIGLMVYSFARIGAALAMRVEDVFHQHRRLWVRLHEKGGKHHEMPCHHNLEHYLQDYLEAAGIGHDRKGPLFRTIDRSTGLLSDRALPAQNTWEMVRRARQAGIKTLICNHTFRATGITTYEERRPARESRSKGRPFVDPHHPVLRPALGRGHARADRDLNRRTLAQTGGRSATRRRHGKNEPAASAALYGRRWFRQGLRQCRCCRGDVGVLSPKRSGVVDVASRMNA